jgi:TrmH family RNA methyltransferase
MPRVTSPRNPRLALAQRLIASSRERRKTGRCILEGEHLIATYLDRLGAPETLLVADASLARPAIDALAARVPRSDVLVITERVFREIANAPPEIGVLAVVPTPRHTAERRANFCVLLDRVQDPGNVGTMLRSAAAAGVEQVLLSKDCAFAWSPKTLRAGQGAQFLTTIVEDVDLPAWTRGFRADGGRIAAAVARGGTPLYECDLRGRVAIAIGSEGVGLTADLAAACDLAFTIPMARGVESLNAAAAAAIALFECVRQRRS